MSQSRITDINVDPDEIAKFDQISANWWNPDGQFAPLHQINPLRTGYIADRTAVSGARVVDIGCGGGLLCEALAHAGAIVTGIDAAAVTIDVARDHALQSGLTIDYQQLTAEQLAAGEPASFDIVTCLEMLEHVPEPADVVAACAHLVKPGGSVFFSTINRNPKAWLLAVVGAEYVLDMIPRGTHDYSRFIRPSELSDWSRQVGLAVCDISGMHYNPLTRQYTLGGNVDVNYLMHLRRPLADESS